MIIDKFSVSNEFQAETLSVQFYIRILNQLLRIDDNPKPAIIKRNGKL